MSCGAAGAALCCEGGESQGLVIALEAPQLESWIALATARTQHQHIRHDRTEQSPCVIRTAAFQRCTIKSSKAGGLGLHSQPDIKYAPTAWQVTDCRCDLLCSGNTVTACATPVGSRLQRRYQAPQV